MAYVYNGPLHVHNIILLYMHVVHVFYVYLSEPLSIAFVTFCQKDLVYVHVGLVQA